MIAPSRDARHGGESSSCGADAANLGREYDSRIKRPAGCGLLANAPRRVRSSAHHVPATTLLRRTPIPLISISTVSPGFMFCGSPSVPIHITSPGSMVQYFDTSAI